MTVKKERLTVLRESLDKYLPALTKVLPENMSADRLAQMALLAAHKNPDLLECSAASMVLATMRVAQLGLDIGVTAHIIPYRSGKHTMAQVIVDYRGMIDLAMRGGRVLAVEARVRNLGDVFEIEYGTHPRIHHVPKFDGVLVVEGAEAKMLAPEVIGVYAVAYLANAPYPKFEYMTRAEIEEARNGRGGPWVAWFGEMAKKTVLRRLCKTLPQNPELAAAIELNDRADGFDDKLNPLLDLSANALREQIAPPTVPRSLTDMIPTDEPDDEGDEDNDGDDAPELAVPLDGSLPASQFTRVVP